MPSQPFQSAYSDCRVVEIPTGLDPEVRKRFVARVNEAVSQQLEISRACDGVLKPAGEVREEGDRLIIPHERAAPADPEAIVNDDTRPDIQTLWWLTWATTRALRAAEERNITHGGIQFSSLYRDESGRLKLGDFGIAQAYETVCGVDGRRYVACTSAPQADPSGRNLSGVWSLLDEQTSRDFGWIAPYFGHELLEGRTRLNPKSDQFALGSLLFVWATGTHPYGVELSDPNQMIYFQLEPYPLEEERTDWADAFERAETDVQTSADQTILSWRELTSRLLAADPKDRFKSLDECLEVVGKHGDEQGWSAASKTISEAIELLDSGNVQAFLEKITPLSEGNSLPSLWRDHLSGYVKHAEEQKEAIARRKALEKRLREGNQALERQDVEAARTIAQEVRDAPDGDDEMRSSAEALLALCDEHDALLKSGAAELARQNIAQARESIERDDLADARQYIDIIKQDPSAPEQLKAEAQGLLTEIEQAEQRISGYLAELTQATVERREGQVDSARERIAALLAVEQLPESVAAQARLLQKDIEDVEQRYDAYAKTLDEALQAFERLDAGQARALLDGLPQKKLSPELANRRADQLERLAPLKSALDIRRAAEALFDDAKPAEARVAAERALDVEGAPEALRTELSEFVSRCESALAAAEKAALQRALDALEKASAGLEELNIPRCLELLDSSVQPFEKLPDEARRRAEKLRASCDAAATAMSALDRAEQSIATGDFDAADTALREAPTSGLPEKLVARSTALAAQIEKAREDFVKDRRKEIREQLEAASAAVESGDVAKADELLGRVEQSPYLTDEMRETVALLRGEVEKFRPVLDAIADAERALAQGDLERARKLAGALPREVEWAAARAADLERRVAKAEEAARKKAIDAVEQGLVAAQSALDRLDPVGALKAIDAVKDDLALEKSLGKRAETIATQAKTLQKWMPKVDSLDQLIQRGELAQAYREANALLKKEGIPEPIAKRVRGVGDDAKKRISKRQEEIKAELAAVADEIEKRKRRAKRVEERLGAVISDALAAKTQKSQAEELLKQYLALPIPKPPIVPIGIGVGVLSVAAVIVFMMTRPASPASLLADALGGLTDQARAAVTNSLGTNHKPFDLYFDPAESFPSRLLARINGSQSGPDLGSFTEQQIEAAAFTDAQRDLLVPTLRFSHAELLDIALPKVKTQATAAAAGRYPRGHKSFALELRPTDRLPSVLYARIEGGDDELTLGDFTESDANSGVVAAARLTPLLDGLELDQPEPKADINAIRRQATTDADAADSAHLPFTLKLVPVDAMDGELFITVEAKDHSLGNLVDGVPRAGWLDDLNALVKPRDPTMPMRNDIANFNAAVDQALLGRNDVSYTPITLSDLTATADFGQQPLVPINLRYDETSGFSQTPAQVARHFALQADALAALTNDTVIVALGDRYSDYDGSVTFIDPSGNAKAVKVDLGSGRVTLSISAVLAGDNRANASFVLSGDYTDGTLSANDDGRLAFGDYLEALQQASMPTAPTEIAGAALPAGVTVGATVRSGNTVEIEMNGMSGVRLKYMWRPSGLTYVLDQAQALQQIRAWMTTLATKAALTSAWNDAIESVAPEAGGAGADFFRNAQLVDATPMAASAGDSPFVLNIDLVIGPIASPADDVRNTSLTWRVTADAGGVRFDASKAADIKIALVRDVAAKSADAKFRQAQADKAIAALQPAAQGHETPQFSSGQTPLTLTANVTRGGKQQTVRWTWDAPSLSFVNPKASSPLADDLAALASAADPDVIAFVKTLATITKLKCDAYSPSGRYAPSVLLDTPPANEQDARDTLRDMSRSLQKLIAPRPELGVPYPLVFIEYFIQDELAYGMGWIATVDGNETVEAVQDLKVWPITQLPNSDDGPGLLAYYDRYSESPEVGNELLAVIPPTIAASPRGTWGVMVAPSGPLWGVRWSEVQFDPRNVDANQPLNWTATADPARFPATPDLNQFGHIGELLEQKAQMAGTNAPLYVRGGIWSVPSLGGMFQRRGGRKTINIGLTGFSLDWKSLPRPLTFPILLLTHSANFDRNEWSAFAAGRTLQKDYFGLQFWLNDWSTKQGVWTFCPIQARR